MLDIAVYKWHFLIMISQQENYGGMNVSAWIQS